MDKFKGSRRQFLKAASLTAGAALVPSINGQANPSAEPQAESGPADYTLRIQISPVELAPDRIVSTTTYFHCHQQLHMDFGFMTLFDYL